MWNRKGMKRLMNEIKKDCPYNLQDLFKIRDALRVLEFYNLEDRELLSEVEMFIEDWREPWTNL